MSDEEDYYEEDEVEWILDSVTTFMKSPLWKNQIMDFIDDNCMFFDSEDENKLCYTDIHNKFKNLIDLKLEKFIKELGIEQDAFLIACDFASTKLHKSIVTQLVAVDNFVMFKNMMVNRNKVLNAEAMEELAEDKEDAA